MDEKLKAALALEDARRERAATAVAARIDPEVRRARLERITSAGIPLEQPHMPGRIARGELEDTPMLVGVRRLVDVGRTFMPRVALLLTGDMGRGKTVAAAYAIGELGGRYLKLEEACELADKRATVAEKADLRACIAAPVLVVDELGAELNETLGSSVFGDIIDRRQGRFTIVISNLSRRALERRYDPRTFDRIGSRLERIEDGGPSFRARRPWRLVFGVERGTEASPAFIEERYATLYEYYLTKGRSVEDRVELSDCYFEARAEARRKVAA